MVEPAFGSVERLGLDRVDVLLAAARSGHTDLLMVAGRYTLAEQTVFPEVLAACDATGVGIVNASVFNSGLLATNDPGADSRYEYGGVSPEQLARVQAIAAVAREHGVELPAAALQYTARDPRVRTVVVGSSKPAQVWQNVERMRATIPDEFWTELLERGLVQV